MRSSTGRIAGNHCFARMARPVLLALALGSAAVPPGAAAQDRPFAAGQGSEFGSALAGRTPAAFRAFYAARGWKPLWLDAEGAPRPALDALLDQVETSRLDGINPSRLKAKSLRNALAKAEPGNPDDAAKVELAAARLYVAWVQALRSAPAAPMIYESRALAPVVPTPAAALAAAAHAPSLERYMADMGWMHPFYAPLRAALLDPDRPDDERRRIALNLARVRALPATPAGRYVLVDAAGARLWMMEDGRPVGSMKVVVGKVDNQTPMMAGYIRFATLNPYWNVPVDLVQQRIAPNVLDKGLGYLKASGYQVLSGWDDDARILDPATVDWRAVADGSEQLRVRQLPGGDNFMGKVKFEFPNPQGIYLHDTPAKNLMLKDERQFSSGCVRLEDAPRLGRWLMGKPLPRKVNGAEQRMALAEPVPVYITYLTALPEGRGQTVAFQPDPYGRDGNPERLATALR